MSKPTSTSNSTSLTSSASALKSSASAWARGPPSTAATPSHSAVNSTTASPSGTPNPKHASLQAVPPQQQQTKNALAQSTRQAGQSAHSRKSSVLAVGGEHNGDHASAQAAVPNSNAASQANHTSDSKPISMSNRTASAVGINFGSVSNPNAELSSSPAANPTIGSHLGSSDGVKSFGTVEAADAETVEKNGILGRKPAPAAGSKFDVNKLFQMPAAPGGSTGQASSSSSTSNSGFRPNSNQPMMQQAGGYDAQGRPLRIGSSGQPLNPFMPSSQTAPAGGASTGPNPPRPSNGSPSASSIPAQNPRSPIMGHQQPPGTNPYAPGSSAFRPGAPSHNAARGPSSQMGPQGNRAQQVHAYGMHPGQQHGGPGYPGMPYGGPQGYYAYGYYAPESAYSQGQWQTGQGPTPASTPLSPRLGNVSANVGSPAPSHAAPNASGTGATPGVGRPVPNHNNSNYSVSSQTSGPSTPAQAHARPASFQPGQPFTPGHISSPSANLTASANAFVPRAKSSAIKITREDGTAIDLASAAKELKTPGQSAEVLAVPATPTPPAKAQLPSMPVVVRMETEAQKAKRIADLESSKKRKALEEKEEAERKERETARKVKEEAELKEKAEQETAAANEKRAEESRIAEEKAQAEALEKQQAELTAADSKAREEAAEQRKKAEATKRTEADISESQDPEVKHVIAGLPSKPSAEVLESAGASSSVQANPALGTSSEGVSSLAPSPSASPSLAHAGLPAKPASFARKGAPTALDLPTNESTQQGSAAAQALLTARPIDSLDNVVYPSGTHSPKTGLNAHATAGKFRYDREFLLQFMGVCQGKPDSLPPLDQLGMEKDHSSMGRGGSSRGGQRSGSQMGGPRGSGMGGGPGGMGSFGGKSAGGMGSFGMGSFNRPAATSEERMAASRINNMGSAFGSARNTPGMTRSPSQSGPAGISMMAPAVGRESSRTGSARGKRRGEPRGPPPASTSQLDADVAPLEMSANRWTPGVQSRRPGAIDESSPEYIERKVKGLLNKLTKEKFVSISNQILEWGNKSIAENDGQTLRLVIKLIFEKAKDEQFWSSMYAELCHKLLETLSSEIKDEQVTSADGTPLAGGVLFRKYLLNRCQEDFERGWKNKEDASAAAKSKASEDEKNKAAHDEAIAAGQQVEEFKFSDEYYAEQAAKRQGLGLVKFVGELFKLDMLSLKIMNACIVKLLHNIVNPDEEDVESLCQLISTVGSKIQRTSAAAAGTLNVFISRMTEMSQSPNISSRMRFMLMDVIESYDNGWKSRTNQSQSGPMTIDEVHRQAAKEHADAARAAANAPMNRDGNMSRSGSKRGDQRSGFGGMPGANDQWQSVGNRPPPKAADMTGFGNIKIGGGPSTFGPSSVFANKKKPKTGDVTPPMSRSASTSNMFSALRDADASGEMSSVEEGAGGAEAPQRKKLVLAPRTVSSANIGEEETAPEAQSKEDVERKIKADLAEFWGEKGTIGTRNTDDVVTYFENLSEDARSDLARQLVDDVFRLSSAEDTKLVAEAFTKAIAAGVLQAEAVKQGLLPSVELLDDLAIDVPQAYNFAAQLIISANLPDSDVETLADAVEVLGEPMVKPGDKLKAQVQKLRSG